MHRFRAALATLLMTAAAAGQDAAKEPPATIPATGADAPREWSPLARASLLREGSTLLRVTGHVQPDPRRQAWTFSIDPVNERGAPHRLTVMPNTHLWELEQIVESMPGDELSFEVTGQVFVYRSHNYILLTHPPRLVGRGPAATPTEPVSEPDEAPASVEDGDSAADIIRSLEQDVGPVARRPVADAPATGKTRGWREGEFVLDRLGGVRRSGDGSFVFLFHADADGLADPPMVILPCLQLERIETTLRRRGAATPLLVSGTVHTYGGRAFLLPTLYRVPARR
jgi:hypothetical protein